MSQRANQTPSTGRQRGDGFGRPGKRLAIDLDQLSAVRRSAATEQGCSQAHDQGFHRQDRRPQRPNVGRLPTESPKRRPHQQCEADVRPLPPTPSGGHRQAA